EARWLRRRVKFECKIGISEDDAPVRAPIGRSEADVVETLWQRGRIDGEFCRDSPPASQRHPLVALNAPGNPETLYQEPVAKNNRRGADICSRRPRDPLAIEGSRPWRRD